MKKFFLLLLLVFLLLGTSFTVCSEAQKKSNSAGEKSQASKTISKKQLESWINQLSEGSFRERRVASNNLMKAGKQALPFLVKGAHQKNTELSARCFDIFVKMYRGKDKTLYSAAHKALVELEKSSKKSVAQRAKNFRKNLQDEAIDGIKKLGGYVTLDKSGMVQYVILGSDKVTDSDLVHLKGLTKLQRLDLTKSQVTGSGFVHLKGLTDMKGLGLDSTHVSDSGLEHLKVLTKLQKLDLFGTKVTDAGLVHLQGMIKLELLNLYSTKIFNAGLVHLKGLANLKSLSLGDTQVTDAGLVHLKGMTTLKFLWLSETKITDAGLVHLTGLTNLQRLYLNNSKVTEAGVKKLKVALPKCDIWR